MWVLISISRLPGGWERVGSKPGVEQGLHEWGLGGTILCTWDWEGFNRAAVPVRHRG